MKLKQFKEWINTLDDECDGYEVVLYIPSEMNSPISAIGLDDEREEIILMDKTNL